MASDYFATDTIAAVATSLAGDAGVGIIRLSGPKALEAARKLAPGLGEKPEPRYLHRIDIVDPASREVLDDGLAAFFAEGQSFTGEQVVELQLHGGRLVLQTVLKLLIESGLARMALPGEFSFRAVRNGKLTLAGAQAIGQVISAKSAYELQAARRSLGQARVREFDEMASRLRNLLAQSELSIDFIDQDVEVISLEAAKKEVGDLLGLADRMLAAMRAAQRLARGLEVTFAGLPNAGKSTLFNAVLAEERAIVSAEAGTTRDVITEEIRLGPYYVRLADTAGLRATDGEIEREGISRARALAADSDLVVLVVDSTLAPEALSAAAKAAGESSKPIIALNKWDLVPEVDRSRKLAAVSPHALAVAPLSAKSGFGVAELLAAVEKHFDGKYGLGLRAFLPTEFQLQMLLECRRHLEEVVALLSGVGLSHPELVSAGLSASVRALSDLVGETTPDTVLAKIFSEFCIGK